MPNKLPKIQFPLTKKKSKKMIDKYQSNTLKFMNKKEYWYYLRVL